MPAEPLDDDQLDLRAYVAVLRRRWRWIAGTIVVVVLAALALTVQQDPLYQATAEVLIRQRATEGLFTNEQVVRNAADAERQLNNEVEVIESGSVRDVVDDAYDGPLDVDKVSARPASDRSDAVGISATGTDPDLVAELVNRYTAEYISYSGAQRVNDLLRTGAEIQAQIDDLDNQLDELNAPLRAIEAQLAADPGDDSLQAQREQVAENLAPQTTAIENRQDFYRQQLENTELSARIIQSGGPELLTEAEPPASPISPQPIRNTALALVLGALLGIGLAFVRDHLDDTIRTTEDLDRIALGELPTIGLIPALEDETFGLVIDTDPKGPTAEAYRTLRTAVRFAGLDRTMKVVQLTSSNLGEGKTTTIANLAVALAQAGQKVAVVCCDLRRPRVHELFGQSLSPGFTDVLLGEAVLSQALRMIQPNLYLLPAGSRPPNPSELLGAARTESVIAALRAEFDFVLLDSTPILPVTDGLVVAHLADATIVVVNARSTTRQQLRQALSLLRQADAALVGFVLNRVPLGGRGGYGYSYAYAYAETESTPVRRGGRGRRGGDIDAAPERVTTRT